MNSVSPVLTVLRRELLVGLRSGAGFSLLVAAVSIMTFMAWSTVVVNASMTYRTTATMGELFASQQFLLTLIVWILVPALAAVSVNSERDSECHELLATSLIPPGALIAGKFLAVVLRALLMASALLPFTGLVYFYAGVDLREARDAAVFLGPSLLANAAIGVWASARFAGQVAALMATFLLSCIHLGLFLPDHGLLDAYLLGSKSPMPIEFTAALIPLSSHLFPLLHVAFGALVLGAALWQSGHCLTLDANTPRQRRTETSRDRFRPIRDGANPFAARECYGSILMAPGMRLGLFFGLFIGLMATFLFDFKFIVTILTSERFAAFALIPAITAVSLHRDRNEIVMDAYRCTLLDSAVMLRGKLRGKAQQFAPLLAASLLFRLCASAQICFFAEASPGARFEPNLIDIVPLLLADLVILPMHLAGVALSAAIGAAVPRSLVGKLLGAYLSTLICGLGLAIFPMMIVGGAASAFEESLVAMVFGFGFYLLAFLAGAQIVAGFAFAMYSIPWDAGYSMEAEKYRRDEPSSKPSVNADSNGEELQADNPIHRPGENNG